MRPHEVRARIGVSERQLRYWEEKGHLGAVERNGRGERVFSPEQIRFLEAVETLRESGVRLEEAAAMASEVSAGIPRISNERLQFLTRRSLDEVERSLRTALVVWSLVRQRSIAGDSADGQP